MGSVRARCAIEPRVCRCKLRRETRLGDDEDDQGVWRDLSTSRELQVARALGLPLARSHSCPDEGGPDERLGDHTMTRSRCTLLASCETATSKRDQFRFHLITGMLPGLGQDSR